MKRVPRTIRNKAVIALMVVLGLSLSAVGLACGEGETVIQTVVVEREVRVPGEAVIQTVVVEKAVPG